ARFGVEAPSVAPPPELASLRVPEPRLDPGPPASLESLCTQDLRERAVHALGKSYDDLVRGISGDYRHAPDLVVYPANEQDVERVLAWCTERQLAAIPFGGGSSVVRGIEPAVGDGYAGTVSIDLQHLDRVLEIDRGSRTALIQGGIFGPHLEE